MFLSDPSTIQSHLNNDWTLLLKNIKNLQDHHLQLLQYNHKIINTVREQNNQLFVHDQICRHKNLNNQISGVLSCVDEQEIQILEKYEQMCIREDGVIRLMGRVGARVLEICQNSFDKCKQYDQALPQKHTKMRRAFLELLNNKDGLKLDQIIKCITAYAKQKLLNEQQRLKRLITTFQNGQFDKLKEVYLHKEKKQVVKSVQRKLDIIRDLSKAKAEKENIKNDNKVKKQKQRIINHLYSPMQLAKQQHNDQESQSVSDKTQKLYNEILHRNKFNSQQIIQFEQESITFPQKTKIFKECLQRQEKKTGEIFVRRVLKKEKQQIETRSQKVIAENAHTKSLQTQIETNIQNIMTEGNIDPQVKNQKKLTNTQQFKIKSLSKKEPNDLPNIFTSFVITHQNFSAFKFDPLHRQLFTRTNRHILPDIASKGTSLDQNTQITKIKIDKILRTTAKKDFFQDNARKHENTRKSMMSTRQDQKGIQDHELAKLRFKGINLTQSLAKRVHLQRNRHEINNEDNPLHVKKAEIKYFQQKNTIL